MVKSQKMLRREADVNADQIEFNALKYKRANFNSGIEDESISGVFDDYEIDGGNDEEWALHDREKDDAVGNSLKRLEERCEILGDAYPFELKSSSLILKEDIGNFGCLLYKFCLAISNASNITIGENVKLPRVFEKVAAELTTLILGKGAKWLHTGWPREDGLISFNDLASHIKKQIGSKHEWSWLPDSAVDERELRDIKDGGMDYISWIDFFNQRDGRLYLLGQCACGNNWDTKYNDLSINKLKRWFRIVSFVPSVKILAIPFCSSFYSLKESAGSENILLDRIRLALLCENNKHKLSNSSEIEELIQMVLD